MSNFLVLGLPRSRTAWLANFLTYGDITCTHEGLNGCMSLNEYKDKFTKNSGDSNTGLAYFEFEPLFIDFKKIIIDSGIRKSVEFARKTYGRDSFDQIVKLKKRLDSIKGLHVPYHDIDDNLELIWDYVSRYQFNEKRAAQLTKLNIQIRDPFSMDVRASAELFKNTNHYL
jgi:hypothetical protein